MQGVVCSGDHALKSIKSIKSGSIHENTTADSSQVLREDSSFICIHPLDLLSLPSGTPVGCTRPACLRFTLAQTRTIYTGSQTKEASLVSMTLRPTIWRINLILLSHIKFAAAVI